jgi:hypothetical protein
MCCPFFCIFSSLKNIRISYRGEHKATWFDFGEKLVLTCLIKKHWDLTSKNWNWLDIISDVTSKLEDLTMSDVSLTNTVYTVHWVDLMVKMAEKTIASFLTQVGDPLPSNIIKPISDYSCNYIYMYISHDHPAYKHYKFSIVFPLMKKYESASNLHDRPHLPLRSFCFIQEKRHC